MPSLMQVQQSMPCALLCSCIGDWVLPICTARQAHRFNLSLRVAAVLSTLGTRAKCDWTAPFRNPWLAQS
jgi:hypothetical protein